MSYQSQRLSTIFALCFLLTLSPVGSSARLVRRASHKPQTGPENRLTGGVSQFRRQTTFDSSPVGSSSSTSSFLVFSTDVPVPTSRFLPIPTSIPFFSTTSFPNSASISFPIFDGNITSSASSQAVPTTLSSPPSLSFSSAVVSKKSTEFNPIGTGSFPTEGPQYGESSHSTPILLIGLTVGIACLLSVCIAGFFLLRRKRKQRLAKREISKVEKPFGSEEGFHLIVETGSEPTSVIPFSGSPSSRRPPQQPSSLASLTVPTKYSKSSDGSSPISDYSPTTEYASPNSAVSQQNLLDQLSSLRAQIQQVEALARTQGLNPTSSGQSSVDERSEPPPEYDANLGNVRSLERIDEKGPLF